MLEIKVGCIQLNGFADGVNPAHFIIYDHSVDSGIRMSYNEAVVLVAAFGADLRANEKTYKGSLS